MPPPELTVERRRALQPLAEAPNGHTDAALRARGFTPTLLVDLVARGYAVAKPQTMKAAGKTFGFMRFVITDSGRSAIMRDMARSRFNDPIEPMTLGNIRANGCGRSTNRAGCAISGFLRIASLSAHQS